MSKASDELGGMVVRTLVGLLVFAIWLTLVVLFRVLMLMTPYAREAAVQVTATIVPWLDRRVPYGAHRLRSEGRVAALAVVGWSGIGLLAGSIVTVMSFALTGGADTHAFIVRAAAVPLAFTLAGSAAGAALGAHLCLRLDINRVDHTAYEFEVDGQEDGS